MISYIKGEITEIKEDSIVIEANNIGYNVFVPASVFSELPSMGKVAKIYTFFHVKEDALSLFGFSKKDDLDVFKKLLTVNGVGPKGAIKILGGITPDELRMAIITNDIPRVSSVPGIGKKTAEKIIIELRDKIHLEDGFAITDNQNAAKDNIGDVTYEVVCALTSLGYSDSLAYKAVKKVTSPETKDVGALLKESLKIISML